MKNLFRILGITLLTVFYCATISMALSGFSQNSGFINKTGALKEKSESTVSIKLLSDISQSESLAEPSNITPPFVLKNTFNDFFAIIKIKESFFANEFAQYTAISINLLIKHRKANIIFPFHYFW